MPRWIELDGVVNMRDVGGLPTRDDRETLPGRLIRSDNLQNLSARDVRRLVDELGVSDIVDLRTHGELEATGDGPLRATPARHHHFSFFDDHGVSLQDLLVRTREAQAAQGDGRVVKDAAYWSAHYRGYLERRPDTASDALRTVADADGATIVHCAAGKDRTGTVVALALDVAGVPHEEIVADYLLTDERIVRIIERLATVEVYGHLDPGSVQEQRPAAEAMIGLLESVDELGGTRELLRSQGWSHEQVDALATRLVG